MGNKEISKDKSNSENNAFSPNKKISNSVIKSNSYSNKIYSEEKINKYVENSKIIGYKLSETIEPRRFFIVCSICGNYFLDLGIKTFVECIKCNSNLNVEKIQEKINELDEKNDEIKYLKTLDKEIKEILELELSVNYESLPEHVINNIDKNIENTDKSNCIDYDLILKQVLLPFFKIKYRILKKRIIFEIGDIQFKVLGLSPTKYGYISNNTFIRLNNYFSTKDELKRVLIMSINKSELNKKDIIDLYFDQDIYQVSKNEVIKVNRSEFLIKNCEPSSGLIVKNKTIIEIENDGITNINMLHLAIIKNDKISNNLAENNRLLNEYVHKQLYKPYFLSGISRYIERGDHFKVDDFDFFVLNCNPIKGFVDRKTGTSLIFGLTVDLCQKKIKNADQKYADYLSKQYEIESIKKGLEDTGETVDINLNLMNNEEFNAQEIINEDELLSQNLNSEQLIASYTNCEFNSNTSSTSNNLFNSSSSRSSRQLVNNQLDLSRIFETMNVCSNENRNPSNSTSTSSTNDLNSNYISDYNNNNHSSDYLYQYDLEMFLYSLPEISIDTTYLKYIDQKKKDLDNITKCMICYGDFEINETIKTLPCIHFFHSSCILKWFKEKLTCPICNFEIIPENLKLC